MSEIKDKLVTAENLKNAYNDNKNKINELKGDFVNKIDKPTIEDNNKFPRAKNGNVEWVEQGLPTDKQTSSAVQNWLNEHPEATTTVDYTITTKVFDNVAQMKADQHLKAGDKCKTLGYYSVNDGGSAYYYIRTKEISDIDDGGSIHILENDDYIAELIVGDYITPELFGAKGNGVTDDSDALTNLFNYGLNNNIKKFVFTHDKYLVNGVTRDGVIGYFYKFDAVDNLEIIGLNSILVH